MTLNDTGCIVFEPDAESTVWAKKAATVARRLTNDPDMQSANLRHGKTWFVGVDALPNDTTGALDDVPFNGLWQGALPADLPLHPAQVSVIYPGYPQRDPNQTEANHQFRMKRCAAHVDGLLPEGMPPRRFAREFHAYVLGVHLNACVAGPTMYWPGSHRVIGEAIRVALNGKDPSSVDLTETYQEARRSVFEQFEPKPVTGPVGGAFLMHRFVLHGTAPWTGGALSEGRMTAFFRPQFTNVQDWLAPD